MAYPITDIRGIGADTAAILKSEGIRTTVGLLRPAKTPKQRLKIAEKVGIDDKYVLDWVTAADRMRVKGVGWEYSELLLRRRRQDSQRTQVPQPAETRRPDDRSQYQTQTGALVAIGEMVQALDRERQEAAARHSLLIVRL